MDNCPISITISRGAKAPRYSSSQAAGADVCAFLPEGPVEIRPMERVLVPTGIRIALPAGFEAQIRSRSGLAIKKGIAVLNSPGTIDSDYRGEVGIILINLSQDTYIVNDGDRIAQMIIARHETAVFNVVENLDQTERGSGGFGSTGLGN